MWKWSRESLLILGVVTILVGLELFSVQKVTLTKDATVFLAKQTNHPQLAAAQTLEELTGSNQVIQPLQVHVWIWLARGITFVGLGIIIRNAGKN
ncbi:MAG: hypothetical protein LBJ67_19105 [Planctomycetaceae bacterium]|jgi:hypothetical protein|nr:hypothetical protein [Planctomycetaceae bacterium]